MTELNEEKMRLGFFCHLSITKNHLPLLYKNKYLLRSSQKKFSYCGLIYSLAKTQPPNQKNQKPRDNNC